MNLLPQNLINDAGSSSAGSVYGGPFTGPDSFQETGLTFLIFDRDVTLKDAISQLGGGGAPTQQHAYLLSVGDTQNVVGVLYSTQLPPNSQFRHVVPLSFKKGETLYIRAVQLSEASTPEAEATQLVLSWA